jgi:hypothetical protein
MFSLFVVTMESQAKHLVLSQHQVVVLTCEAILNTPYRMSRHPLCSPPAQYSPNTASSRINLLGFIYGDHKEAPSIIGSVMPVDLLKQGIWNESPKIRYISTLEIFDGLPCDKMQNLKVRCKTIPIYGQFHRPLGLFSWEVFKNFHLDKLLVFLLTSHTSTNKN